MTANNKDRCVVLLHSLTQDTSSITFHNLDCHIFNLKKIGTRVMIARPRIMNTSKSMQKQAISNAIKSVWFVQMTAKSCNHKQANILHAK